MVNDSLKIKGFYRINVKDGESVIKDTGWVENQVVNAGVDSFLLTWLGAGTGGYKVSHMALGTGAAPAKTDSTLAGETGARTTVTSSLTNDSSSRIILFTGQFAAGSDMPTGNLANIGLFDASTSGHMFSGAAYSSMAIQSSFSVLASYALHVAN
jgi:hypothetical protein